MHTLCQGSRIAGTFMFGIIVSSVAATALAKEPWEEKWDQVLAAARKEGVVAVSGPPGAFQRRAITEGWAKAYPDIKLNYVGARGTQIVSKVVRERTSGLYNWDIILASTDPTVFSLKPINALAPLRDAIIRPDITQDKSWIDSFESGFLDKDRKFFYSPVGTAGTLGFVNRDCVSKNDFSKIADIKKPQFVGKIAWHDPTRPGTSTQGLGVLYLSVGEAWIKDMFQNHKVTFSRDYRQMTDWLVNCAKPIVMGMPNDVLEQMQKQGIGKNVEEMDGLAYAGKVNPGGVGGNASIGWYNNAPHPNAGKVFVNWYLSKEFQQHYATVVKVNSRRADVKPADSRHVLDPSKAYFNTSEENVRLVKDLQARVKTWGVLGSLGKKKR
jgi:ABC-type Fe3+ transport system substrate-binding protein